MENKKHWINTFYVYEIFLFITGVVLLFFGYNTKYLLFSIAGAVVFFFAMVLSFMQKRKS